MKKIIFVNQSTGHLFGNIIEAVSTLFEHSVLLCGNNSSYEPGQELDNRIILRHYSSYWRQNKISRLVSGLQFVFSVINEISKVRPQIVFFVSNPPFMGIFIFFMSKYFRLKYSVLVYDIYPDVLVGSGVLKNNNVLVKLWRSVNKIVYENSNGVITIGESMANVLNKQFNPRKTRLGTIKVIHNCADGKVFKPLVYNGNKNTVSGLKIVYSGNFGFTHDFDTILDTAKKLNKTKHRFFLVGEGAKKKSVDTRISSEKITNVISLPFFKESDFPGFISSADVAIITMSKGCENLMMPSKIYISMAVGSALIGITEANSDVARIIRKYRCGVVVPVGDSDALFNAIEELSNLEYLYLCKNNSINAFNRYYTKEHTSRNYVDIFKEMFFNNYE